MSQEKPRPAAKPLIGFKPVLGPATYKPATMIPGEKPRMELEEPKLTWERTVVPAPEKPVGKKNKDGCPANPC